MTNCCRECNERHATCHSTCEKYKEWLEEHKKQKKIAKSNERKFYDFFYK